MKRALDQETVSHSLASPARRLHPVVISFLQAALYISTGLLAMLALFAGGWLLLGDLVPQMFIGASHAPFSAAPLLLIGAAGLVFQVLTRPRPLELLKSLLVCLAFILWGIDQMLSPGWLTTTVGDLVIVLYVIDLGCMMGATLRRHPTWRRRPPSK